MRGTLITAAFLVVAVGSAGVAGAQLGLEGSSTLQALTRTLLGTATLDCGGIGNTPVGTLSYVGTGSGNGESAMQAGTQRIAPMSRFLDVNANNCSASNSGTPWSADDAIGCLVDASPCSLGFAGRGAADASNHPIPKRSKSTPSIRSTRAFKISSTSLPPRSRIPGLASIRYRGGSF
jgi:hypothetical protein